MTAVDVDRNLEQKLIKALTELPAAYNQLHLFRLPGTTPNGDGPKPRRGTLSTRAPLHLAVQDLLDRRHKKDAEPTRETHEWAWDRKQWTWEDGQGRKVIESGARRLGILPTLSQWVRLTDGELWDTGHDHTPPGDTPTVATECAWLLDQSNWILKQPWVADMADDLTRMLRDCTLITGTSIDTIKLTCLKLGCGWPVQEMDGGAWYRCTGCGDSRGRLELHRMAERKKPKPLVQCAKLSGVSERTLRRMVAGKQIRRVARDGTTDLYDIDQIMQATMNTRYRTA